MDKETRKKHKKTEGERKNEKIKCIKGQREAKKSVCVPCGGRRGGIPNKEQQVTSPAESSRSSRGQQNVPIPAPDVGGAGGRG